MINKKIIAWALYDLANTAFTSPFRTIFWPLLVTVFLNGNEFQLGTTVTLAILIFSIVIPFLGAFSDSTKIRMPFIIIPTLIVILLISALPLFSLFWNLVIVCISIVLYNISLSIYNALLPEIAPEREIGKISGMGMGAGFLGTILSLLAAYLILRHFATESLETVDGIKAVFPALGAFFLVFSLPIFFMIKDTKTKRQKVNYSKVFMEIKSTFKNLAVLKEMTSFLISAALFSNALAAIDVFFFLFAKREIGVSLAGFMILFMAQSVGACLGAIIFGRFADRHGPKAMLTIGGLSWILVVVMFIFSKSIVVFWIAGILGSIAFGGTFAASRVLFIFLAPRKKIGEFFGYSQIAGKFSGLFGPAIAGWLIVYYSYNIALAMVLILLIASFLFLQKIPDVRRIAH